LAAIIVGTGCVLATTAYTLPFLLIGSLLQATGWAILPSTIGRRVAVALPALGFTWLLLGGSGFAWCYTVVLAAWLLVRLRPLIAYVVLALPIVASLVLGRLIGTYEQGWITVLTMLLVVMGSAWSARSIAARFDSWQSIRPLRKQQDRFDAPETLSGPKPKRGMHGTH
jgi:uncharacterized membrane protein SirB2